MARAGYVPTIDGVEGCTVLPLRLVFARAQALRGDDAWPLGRIQRALPGDWCRLEAIPGSSSRVIVLLTYPPRGVISEYWSLHRARWWMGALLLVTVTTLLALHPDAPWAHLIA
jgi:hypothetical protein